jgi:hypothetical protein
MRVFEIDNRRNMCALHYMLLPSEIRGESYSEIDVAFNECFSKISHGRHELTFLNL